MSKHPTGHDRDNSVVAKHYNRIEREHADGLTNPKVRAVIKAAHEIEASDARLRAFLKIGWELDDF